MSSTICALLHREYDVWRAPAPDWAAGTDLRDHVDTTLDPLRLERGVGEAALSPKTTIPLGSSGHLFGSVGHSSRNVSISTGQTELCTGLEMCESESQ